MSLYNQIKDDAKQALKNNQRQELSVLRMLQNSVDIKVKAGSKLDDELVLAVIQQEIKQRQDAISLYQRGGAEEKATAEQQEAGILATYLPQQLTEDEIIIIIDRTIKENQASSLKEMGLVMSKLKAELAARADMGIVSRLVKEKLQN